MDTGDTIITRTNIQNDMDKGMIAKLYCKERKSFHTIRYTGCVSYYVRKLYRLDSTKMTFMARHLFLLSPSVKRYESNYMFNTISLNQSCAYCVSLKKALDIEVYNEKWFGNLRHTSVPQYKYKYSNLNFDHLFSHRFHQYFIFRNQ